MEAILFFYFDIWGCFCFFLNLFFNCIGVTLVNTIMQVPGKQFYNTSLVILYCVFTTPSQVGLFWKKEKSYKVEGLATGRATQAFPVCLWKNMASALIQSIWTADSVPRAWVHLSRCVAFRVCYGMKFSPCYQLPRLRKSVFRPPLCPPRFSPTVHRHSETWTFQENR